MQSQAKTVNQYLKSLPVERREAISAIRKVILNNLPTGYEEGMQYGMIGYYVPHDVYPEGYHCNPAEPLPFVGLASQKNHMALYMMCIYSDAAHQKWFRKAWAHTGKKLDMGKSCIRFRNVEHIPLEVIGEAIRRVPVKKYIEHYESVIKTMGKRPKSATRKKAATKKSKKKTATKRTETKTRKKSAGKRVARRS